VLEVPGGICSEFEKADAAKKAEITSKIRLISDIISSKPNLIYAEPLIEQRVRMIYCFLGLAFIYFLAAIHAEK
jgi:hypothetical protein